MVHQQDIFIDVSTGQFVAGTQSSQIVAPPTFTQGDTANIRLWLLVPTGNPMLPYSQIAASSVTPEVAIGQRQGNNGTIYTQQFSWTASTSTDPYQQYWTGQLAFNTQAISTLLGSGASASAWMEVKYVDNSTGYPTTVLQRQITIYASVIQPGQAVVPPGQTVITAEEANAIFLKRSIDGIVYLRNPSTGAQVAMYVGDDGEFHTDAVE